MKLNQPDIQEEDGAAQEGRDDSAQHPSRSLDPRGRGYGIGGGYEKRLRNRQPAAVESTQSYGPLPHSGYYGAGSGNARFARGQAGFASELKWYGPQYGESTADRSGKS